MHGVSRHPGAGSAVAATPAVIIASTRARSSRLSRCAILGNLHRIGCCVATGHHGRSLASTGGGRRASDFVYSDERNPFDLYRALCRLERDYRSALDTLGPTMVVLSAHGSKLLSVGMLLAAYERAIPIAAAAADEYEIVTGVSLETFSEVNQLCCLWLAGAPYR